MTLQTLSNAVVAYLAKCVPDGDCLINPRLKPGHYGELYIGGRRSTVAHRAVYIAAHGPLSDGQVVRHHCDNRRCVNLAHLEAGSQSQNLRDMFDRGRRTAPWRQGDTHPCAVLTSAIVAELRRRARSGERLWDLSHEYGVTYLTLCAAVAGRTWAHVTEEPPYITQRRVPNPRKLGIERATECLAAAELAAEGLTLKAIGERLGVSRSTAHKMVTQGREIHSSAVAAGVSRSTGRQAS